MKLYKAKFTDNEEFTSKYAQFDTLFELVSKALGFKEILTEKNIEFKEPFTI